MCRKSINDYIRATSRKLAGYITIPEPVSNRDEKKSQSDVKKADSLLNPRPDPLANTELGKVKDFWKEKYSAYYTNAAGRNNAQAWFHIPVREWPAGIFYEFVTINDRRGEIRLDFYAYQLGIYDKIEARLQSEGIKISGKDIEYQPTGNNHGRVELFIPLHLGPERVCEYMKELIDKTKDIITKAI
jgi:hypothetical protein